MESLNNFLIKVLDNEIHVYNLTDAKHSSVSEFSRIHFVKYKYKNDLDLNVLESKVLVTSKSAFLGKNLDNFNFVNFMILAIPVENESKDYLFIEILDSEMIIENYATMAIKNKYFLFMICILVVVIYQMACKGPARQARYVNLLV